MDLLKYYRRLGFDRRRSQDHHVQPFGIPAFGAAAV